MSYYSIQLIKEHDLEGSAFEANKKINFNLQQINSDIELLPVSNNMKPENDSELLYLRKVYECLKRNSKLIGFEYPEFEVNFEFAFKTKEKIYNPINEYFKSLIN
ncbi:hypothetical protein [Acinetobacter courvalinii]|uniref:hypothetical protein n=1 Tax=Acinetobacter courvalinii TaxID=280147 RepID=UPI001900173A|nr:hypothetical protein [Acinetobacter courvalinii]MBJ9958385.1 hypothetical protein [Acinetobacter courvalinii]